MDSSILTNAQLCSVFVFAPIESREGVRSYRHRDLHEFSDLPNVLFPLGAGGNSPIKSMATVVFTDIQG